MTRLFVFEGPDGVGKSTIITEVEKRLETAGRPSVCLSFPGKEDGTLGAHIYKLHHDPEIYGVEKMSPLSLQLLHVAAHVDTIEKRILPLLQAGVTVLLDRYWWSTMVYGLVSGVPKSYLESMISIEKSVWRCIAPSILFVLSRHESHCETCLISYYQDLIEQESKKYPVIQIRNDDSVATAGAEVAQRILAER